MKVHPRICSKLNIIELIRNNTPTHELAKNLIEKVGGEWLGRIRSWIQTAAYNGESVDFGSNDMLQIKPKSVIEMEHLAANIAAQALNEYKNNMATDNQIHAMKLFADPNNWTTNENKEMIFKPNKDEFHYIHALLGIEKGSDLLVEPETYREGKLK